MNNMTRNTPKTLQSFLVILCIMLNMLMPVAFAAGDEPAYLANVKINGLDVVDFDPQTTEYLVEVPYAYNPLTGVDIMKKLEAKAIPQVDGTYTEIIYPDLSDGIDGDNLTIISGEGASAVEYTFELEVIGENLYNDGGFETGEKSMLAKTGTVTLENVSDIVHNGNSAMKIHRTGYGYYYFNNNPVALTGHKYLLSSSVRRIYSGSSTDANIYKPTNRIEGISAPKYYDSDGNPKTSSSSELSEKWNTDFATIIPSTDYSIKNFYTDWIDTDKTIVIDDCYAGELVISDILTNLKETARIPYSEGERNVITPDAKIVNQFSNMAGLEEEICSFTIPEDTEGVYIEGDDIVITNEAIEGILPVTFVVTPSFDNSLQEIVRKTVYVNLVPSGAPTYLADVKINGLDVAGFDPKVTEYTVKVPYVYDSDTGVDVMKQLDAEAISQDGASPVEIIYPELSDGINGDTLTIISGEGNSAVEYTFVLEVVGESLYNDGGFESGRTNMLAASGSVSLENVTDVVYKGSNAMKISRSAFGNYYFNNSPKALAGRKYLLSSAVRNYDETTEDKTTGNYIDKFKGISANYDGKGNPKENSSSKLSAKWNTDFVTIIPNTDYSIMNFYTNWDADKDTVIVIDDCYAGELVIADIRTNIGEIAEIPSAGEENIVIAPTVEVFNQFSNKAGLEADAYTYTIAIPEDIEGVYVEEKYIVITNLALAGKIPVTFVITPLFNDGLQETVEKTEYITLVPAEEAELLPEARNVRILGTIGKNEVLTAEYDYYHIYGEEKGTPQIKWLHSPTEDGIYREIPNTLNCLSYTVEEEYCNDFIKIAVTPASLTATGKTVYSLPICIPTAPEARNISISGTRAIGQTLKGSFIFYDINRDERGECEFSWKYLEDDGSYTPIANANTDKYTITEDDVDKKIVFCVIPVSVNEPTHGAETKTEPVIAATAPRATKVSINNKNGVLNAEYEYHHPNSIKEGMTECRWYLNGVSVAEGFSYKPLSNGIIKVVITPVAQLAPFKGEAVSTEIRYGSDKNGISVSGGGNFGGGGGASFGGGGMSSYVPVPQKPAEEPEQPKEEIIDPNAHWADVASKFAIEKGIMENPKEDDFCYDDKVTRGDFIYYIVKALGLKTGSYNYDFGDVLATDRFSKELSAAVENGIISEYDNFYPGRNVSRQEVCKILVTGMKLTLDEEGTKRLEMFSDNTLVAEWAKEYIDIALSNGVLVGVSETEFNPLGDITRAETAVLVKRIIEYITTGKVGA